MYLHFDPKTRKDRGGKDSVLGRERMDFLLLLPHRIRVVVEVDGQHHYAEGNEASPRLYSKMVASSHAVGHRPINAGEVRSAQSQYCNGA